MTTQTYRIAHLSDVHLGPLPPATARDLLSKRIFGYLNWKRNRAKTFKPGTTDRLVDDLKANAPNHTVVTGDLVNIALEAEFQNAASFLEKLGSPDKVTVIPGNHDAYVPGALHRFNTACAAYLTSDVPDTGGALYPVERRRGSVEIIGLSTAIATPPLMATGHVDQDQLQALDQALEKAADSFQLVLIHHPPFEKAGPNYKRLTNAEAVRDVLAKHGAHLVLHGHTHLPTRNAIIGPNGQIPVFGVASAAQAQGGHRPPASYTLFDIERIDAGWRITATRRGYQLTGPETVQELSRETIEVPA